VIHSVTVGGAAMCFALLLVDLPTVLANSSLPRQLAFGRLQQTGLATATSGSDVLDEQTATVRPNADVTRVVAMLQSTAVLTELGGGSLWQHIGEALKASFGQSRPHVREAHRPTGRWRKL
jgi:hypothetical protein